METAQTPLCVDLDGTLLRGDSLVETFLAVLKQSPGALFGLPVWLMSGRARLKRELASRAVIDVAHLPYREAVVNYVAEQKANGRQVCLASAADQQIVDDVAAHLKLFDEAWGSDGVANLKGAAKQAKLKSTFPEGYSYVGDSSADLAVWKGASSALVVGANSRLKQRVSRLCPIEKEFDEVSGGAGAWLRALRLHQWSKNLLVFVPLLLSGDLSEQSVTLSLLAFLLLSLACSGSYLINDMLDLQEDRAHWTKRERPLAAGQLSVPAATAAAFVLLAASLMVAWLYLPQFAVWLSVYLATTLLYTLHLKQVPILDMLVLGALFTCRVGMGVAVLGHEYSVWLFVFTAFFFFGLAAVKRYVEIARAISREEPAAIRSAYRPEDLNLVLTASVTAGLSSLVVMALYLESGAFPEGAYRSPEWLWCSLPVLGLWLGRIWLLAGRLELADDPVTFALKDRVSWLLGVLLVVSVGLSHI